jgi:hypothetical protein
MIMLTIEEAKKMLKLEAEESHPGKDITYCGNETNWDDCFTVINKKLIFWYNVGKHTYAKTINHSLIKD